MFAVSRIAVSLSKGETTDEEDGNVPATGTLPPLHYLSPAEGPPAGHRCACLLKQIP